MKPHPRGSTKFPVRVLDAVYDRCDLWPRSVCSDGVGPCSHTSRASLTADAAVNVLVEWWRADREALYCEEGPSWHGNCSIPRVAP